MWVMGHGWSWGITSIRPKPVDPWNIPFPCGECDYVRKRVIGLAHHELHKHPIVRNKKRFLQLLQAINQGQAGDWGQKGKGRVGAWSLAR